MVQWNTQSVEGKSETGRLRRVLKSPVGCGEHVEAIWLTSASHLNTLGSLSKDLSGDKDIWIAAQTTTPWRL